MDIYIPAALDVLHFEWVHYSYYNILKSLVRHKLVLARNLCGLQFFVNLENCRR